MHVHGVKGAEAPKNATRLRVLRAELNHDRLRGLEGQEMVGDHVRQVLHEVRNALAKEPV